MQVKAKVITRFAPSPTGPLHLGHAYSAILAHDRAKAAHGTFILRIEDGDTSRCRPHWEAQIYQDLQWLGLTWSTDVSKVSDRAEVYAAALDRLTAQGLIYPCKCTRADISAAISAPQAGVDTAAPYPGTCRHRSMTDRGDSDAIRLDLGKALQSLSRGPKLTYRETGPYAPGIHTVVANDVISAFGDVVLYRRDTQTAAYHLTVVVDDAAQQITEAVRGADLIEATKIHRVLQALLGLETPDYHHHWLVCDESGKRLAKRDDAKSIAKFRDEGATPADIRALVGL